MVRPISPEDAETIKRLEARVSEIICEKITKLIESNSSGFYARYKIQIRPCDEFVLVVRAKAELDRYLKMVLINSRYLIKPPVPLFSDIYWKKIYNDQLTLPKTNRHTPASLAEILKTFGKTSNKNGRIPGAFLPVIKLTADKSDEQVKYFTEKYLVQVRKHYCRMARRYESLNKELSRKLTKIDKLLTPFRGRLVATRPRYYLRLLQNFVVDHS